MNKQLQTDDPAIYAIGDVVGEPMLAHKASHEGRIAVEAIAGHKVAFEPNAIPAVVFTDPEVAWCGLTETQAEKENREIKVAKFPWAASGRAITIDRPEGLTKLLFDPETERVLGVGIVGAGAGEMIAEGVLAIEMAALASDVALTIHPHPTLSETVMECRRSVSSAPAPTSTARSADDPTCLAQKWRSAFDTMNSRFERPTPCSRPTGLHSWRTIMPSLSKNVVAFALFSCLPSLPVSRASRSTIAATVFHDYRQATPPPILLGATRPRAPFSDSCKQRRPATTASPRNTCK